MKVWHWRTYVRLGPTEGFKHRKDLKRLDHTEGEDGQACVRACAFIWSGMVQQKDLKIGKI